MRRLLSAPMNSATISIPKSATPLRDLKHIVLYHAKVCHSMPQHEDEQGSGTMHHLTPIQSTADATPIHQLAQLIFFHRGWVDPCWFYNFTSSPERNASIFECEDSTKHLSECSSIDDTIIASQDTLVNGVFSAVYDWTTAIMTGLVLSDAMLSRSKRFETWQTHVDSHGEYTPCPIHYSMLIRCRFKIYSSMPRTWSRYRWCYLFPCMLCLGY